MNDRHIEALRALAHGDGCVGSLLASDPGEAAALLRAVADRLAEANGGVGVEPKAALVCSCGYERGVPAVRCPSCGRKHARIRFRPADRPMAALSPDALRIDRRDA